MRPLKSLISLDEAIRIAMDVGRPMTRKETVPILDALRRVAASDVRSTIDVPLADRAAMDGYAVLARDTSHARKSEPVALRWNETLYADGVPRKRVTPGRCTEVATGSTLPRGADAVVKVEDTDPERDLVSLGPPSRPRGNASSRAEGIDRGSPVSPEGVMWCPPKIGALVS